MGTSPVRGYFGSDLTANDYAKLEKRYIDSELGDLAGIRRVDSVEGREVVGRKSGDHCGLIIPYTLPGESQVREFRLRRDNPDKEIRNGREHEIAKYVSPPGRGNKIYFPPGVGRTEIADKNLPLIITEGEFKALALIRAARHKAPDLAFASIGIGGVWNWRGKTGRTTGPNGEPRDTKGPVPDLDLIHWDGRRVIIAFDADTNLNDQVLSAQTQLKRELQSRGASVAILNWDLSAGKGIDDVLANIGVNRVLEWIDALRFEDFDWRSKLLVTDKGSAHPCIANAHTMLRHCPEWLGVFATDDFSRSVVAIRETPWGHLGKCTDREDRLVADSLQHQGIRVSTEIAGQAVQTAAGDFHFHPVKDYLKSLDWDGVARIDTWLIKFAGALDTSLNRAIGRMFLIGAIARIYEPGCKLDTIMILEGKQGTKKSTLLRSLSPRDEWFTDEMAEFGSKDAAMQLSGVWFVELPELDSVSGSNAGKIKAFASRNVDRYRPPYAKHVISAPRQCIFVGTVNHHTYLKDETGGRRFLPVTCGAIDIQGLVECRDQLFAEAHAQYHSGATWWIITPDLEQDALEAQAERYDGDPWDEPIKTWLLAPSQGRDSSGKLIIPFNSTPESVTLADILTHCIAKRQDLWTQADKNRVARVLRSFGWERYNSGPRGNRQLRYRPCPSRSRVLVGVPLSVPL